MKGKPLSLAWRLYRFASLLVVVSLGTLVATVILIGRQPADDQIRAVEALASQLNSRFPDNEALVRELHREPSLRTLDLFVYDRRGQLFGGVGTPLAPPTEEELQVKQGAGHFDEERMVVAMGPERVLIHKPVGSGPTWIIVTLLVVIGVSLAIALVATMVFSSTIARPLRALGDAARAFGRGETSVRTRFSQKDELGDVGHAFDEMADTIEQLLRTQRAMMGDISHELRTPLTRIKLALELVNADPQAAQQVLDDVDADLDEIEQIVEDVFEMVRLDFADSPAIRHSELDLLEIVHRSMGRFAAHHTSHAILLETTLDQAPCEGDGGLIRRSLDNLLDNAAKYSPEGSTVTLTFREQANRFEIEVADQGVGMSTDELSLAFTPFWRADRSRTRETGGAGLGLALARRIARAHGGDIELRSSPGAGTIARLTVGRTPKTGIADGSHNEK
jgi:two-component system, OmpR family, sensor kinase